ncbi:tetratricopeptide repeat protein, partial [Candidatus Sumerlaeota bacterium]|nr:tetratricopeptide repeat protein [Candidatus Sumerlaeota bacterium]
MTEEKTPPGLGDLIREWAWERYGVWGLLVIAAIVFAGLVIWRWEHVRKHPILGLFSNLFSRWRIPKADPDRYSVLVARLENDPNREHERRIADTIAREIEGVQVLRLDRIIPLEGPNLEEMEKRGQARAREFLRRSGASALIWGAVVSRDNKTAPSLRWTVAGGEGPKPKLYHEANPEKPFALPQVFWSDLKDTLLLLAAQGDAEFRAEEGHYVADRLPKFIDRVRALLAGSGRGSGWDTDARGKTRVVLADALQILGGQTGQNAPLEEAVAAYREALKERTRERVPLQWATTQNNLGNALFRLGERESGTKRLEEAVTAYREALEVWTRERVPLQWATTQNNLGNALARLGERESGTKRLEEAVTAYREGLREFTRERVPLDWAMTQNNLGNALRALGERESGTERLEEAVAAYREALKERTRERVP